MSKEICISSTPHETRLAILEDDQLAEIYYERENEYTLAGSIYKGRVTRVLPGMQSAFVEVGLERDAFLYVTDFLEEQGDSADFEKVSTGGGRRESAPEQSSNRGSDRGSDRGPDRNPDRQAEPESAAEPRVEGERAREAGQGSQRSRGRGRNRGRGDSQRSQSPRPESQARESQPAAAQTFPVEPFDSASLMPTAHSDGDEYDATPEVTLTSGAPVGGDISGDDESPEGTRRWRGRRGRRGGARREPRENDANATPRAPQAARPEPPSEPVPERVPSITAVYAPSGPAPIVLPGESLSKYRQPSHGQSPQEKAPETPRPSASSATTPSVSARPSTLIEIPLSWDGSGQLPGETISRYRRGEDAPQSVPAQTSPAQTTPAPAEATPAAETSTARPEFSAHSAFESAYDAHEPRPAETAPTSESHQDSPETQTNVEYPFVESHEETHEGLHAAVTEEVTEFDPQEASASHRIDTAAPSEFRVASTVEEEEIHAPVTFQSVAPEEALPSSNAVEAPARLSHLTGEAEAGVPQTAHANPYAVPSPVVDSAPHQDFAAEVSSPERAPESHYQRETEHPAKPESFWKAVKDLVTGHTSAREEHGQHSATLVPAIAASGETVQHSPTAESEQGYKDPEPISEQLSEEGHHLSEPHREDLTPISEGSEDDGSQNFAPGTGLIEEETIEEEEYEYEPMHASADDHDLEDLEEETLEHQGGIEIGEMVRDAHLEQRVKSFNADAPSEEDSDEEEYGEDASGGFTEEDFDGQAGEGDSEEEEEPVAGQIAAPARTDTPRDSRNGDRGGNQNGDSRGGDRGSDRGRGRGRSGRRPGAGGSHSGGGGRRQNTQASDLPPISELLKQGQEILVQIAKEPMAKKGARITSHIALPGRFLVFMPTVNHVGVSRKISSDDERHRLKQILISEKGAAAGGFIVRTAADGASEEDLRADIRFLLSLWSEIKQRSDEAKAPALIYHDLNLIERVLRDQVSDNFSAIWVDSETEYERIVRFLQRFQPSLVRRVKLYSKETPLFEQFGIQEEISKALKSKVWLKSGGSIVINQTEALVAIDINTGKYVGKTARLEDTILRTNLDAIPEMVRQIRLRDLGGIIVIDFIDMDERKNRNRVMQALEDELKNDRAPSKVLQFNDFGLVVITRKRVKQSLERTLSVQCEVCTGTGMVKSPVTVCNEIYTEMRKMVRTLERKDVMLRVHPEVVKSLKSTNGRWLNEMEEMTGKTIIVKSDPALHPEQFDIH